MNPQTSSSSQPDPKRDPETPPPPETSKDPAAKRTISSEEILKGDREVWIRHADMIYRLCVTRNGKLILQK